MPEIPYSAANLIHAIRVFAAARNTVVDSGFTDNGGAIHSVERIMEILCRTVCLPKVKHPKDLNKSTDVEISTAAHAAREVGDWTNVRVEHVMPQRAYARDICERINELSDEDVIAHIRATYRIVLLSKAETRALNQQNRSRITPDRIAEAGIQLWNPTAS